MTVATIEPANPEAPTIFQAMSAAMRQVLAVGKGERNNSQNFSFRGIDAVLNALGPALRNQGIVTVPTVTGKDIQFIESPPNQNGYVKRVRFAVLDVDYTFYGPRGDCVQASVVGEAMDYGDKVVSKAMSVAFRTALIQAFALPTQEADPDSYVYDINGDEPQQQQPQRVSAERVEQRQVRTGPPRPATPRPEPDLPAGAAATPRQAVHEAGKPNRPHPSTGNEQQWLDRLDGAADELKAKTVEGLTNAARTQLGEDHKVTTYGGNLLLWVRGKQAADEQPEQSTAPEPPTVVRAASEGASNVPLRDQPQFDEYNNPVRPKGPRLPKTDAEVEWYNRIDIAADELRVQTLSALCQSAAKQLGDEHDVTIYARRSHRWAQWADEAMGDE